MIVGFELTDDFSTEEPPRPIWVRGFGVGNINDYDTEKSKKTKWFSNMFFDYTPGKSDPKDYLGRSCRVVMKHNQGKGTHSGITFSNLSDVRDYDGELPPISKAPVYFDFDNPTEETVGLLTVKEVNFIKQAINYPGSNVEVLINKREQDNDSSEY